MAEAYAEASYDFFDQDAYSLMDSSKANKWCVMFFEGQVWCKIRFQKPIEIHYYTMTLADNFPGRDPTEWSVEFTTTRGKFKEDHASKSKNTARYAQEVFWLKEPRKASEIKFIFKKNRYVTTGDMMNGMNAGDDGIPRLQLNNIGLFVQDANFKSKD